MASVWPLCGPSHARPHEASRALFWPRTEEGAGSFPGYLSSKEWGLLCVEHKASGLEMGPPHSSSLHEPEETQ